MGFLERGGLLRTNALWSDRARSADLRRKCQEVEDCEAQNARPARPTAKQRREAAKVAARQAEARKEAKRLQDAAKKAKQQQRATWPNAGRYNPQQRGRG